MIRHIAMFRWTPDATAEQKAYLVERLAQLPTLIPTVRAYSFGPDVGVTEGNFEFAIVADFDSVDDYVVYRDHDAHQSFIKDCIAPIRAERASVQFER